MEAFLNQLSAKIFYFFSSQISIFVDNLSLLNVSTLQIVVDILVISTLFYMIIRWVHGTRAVQIITGIAILALLYWFSVIFELVALEQLFIILFPALVVAIPIIFQQELRRGLEQLGQKRVFSRHKTKRQSAIIDTLVEAIQTIKTKRKGASIVLEKSVPLKDYIDTGVILGAEVSTELILSIFLSKAPLHDGAVIIRNQQIIAAGCVLPFSEKVKTMDYGTRHKSAIGLSEITDALVIVVSEEKKEISVAQDGELERKLTPEKLTQMLSKFYTKK